MSVYRIARTAQRDLDEIWCYIGDFDVRAADRWLGTMERRFRLLAARPDAGQARSDLAPELRFLQLAITSSFIGRSRMASRSRG